MDKDEIIDAVVSKIKKRMQMKFLTGKVPLTCTTRYKPPPLILAPREDNLHLIRTPQIPLDKDRALVALELGIERILTESTDRELAWDRVLKMRDLGHTYFSRSLPKDVRLMSLFWLMSSIPEFELEYDETRLTLHTHERDVGLDNGKIISKFEWDYTLPPINPKKFLEESRPQRRVSVPEFILVQGMSRNMGKYEQEVVLILYEALERETFKNLFIPKPHMPALQFRRVERQVFHGKHPFQALFRSLVPTWMNASTFNHKFGHPGKNQDYTDAVSRSILFNKLVCCDFIKYRDSQK